MQIITDNEMFKLMAFKFYRNEKCISLQEFKSDLKRFKYVGNLIEKSFETSIITDRLILNHIITINNLFGQFTQLGLLSRTNPAVWDKLKTLLKELNLYVYDEDLERCTESPLSSEENTLDFF